jgi:uncharacterized protein (TIGR02145 family)
MKTKICLFILVAMSVFEMKAQTIMNIYQNNGTVLQIPLNNIDSITYTITNPGNLATISTTPVSFIGETYAISGGSITNDGGSLITERGVCYSTSPSPTTANTKIINGSGGTGSFSCNLSGLTANTAYYLRAYAINSAGTAYGNDVSFTTLTGGGGIISNPGLGVTFDGYTYSSIVLGNGQEWMAENLKTTIYSNGDAIPNVTDATIWSTLSTPAWCMQQNDQTLENTYGKLYNWYVVTDSRNVCPAGWHLPTHQEWSYLFNYLGGESVAGGKMKTTGTQIWWSPNGGASNESGFSALPGGYRRDTDGEFHGIPGDGTWWSSNEGPSSNVWSSTIGYAGGEVFRGWYSHDPKYGFSIRCLKN